MAARRGRLAAAVAAAAVLLPGSVAWRPALAQPTPPAAITVTVTCDPAAATFSVEVRGVNFNPFTAVLVTFDADAGGRPESFDAATDGFGRFDVTFRTQPRPAGSYLVRADDFLEREATAAAVVSCVVPVVPPPVFSPAMRFHPAVTRGGFLVVLVGSGFPPSAPVQLDWGSLRSRFTPLSVTTDASGGFVTRPVLVFHGTRAGTVRVAATPGGPETFPTTQAPLLVVPGTLQPPDLKERR